MKHFALVSCLAVFASPTLAQVSTGIDVLEQEHFASLRELATQHGGHLSLALLTNPVGFNWQRLSGAGQ